MRGSSITSNSWQLHLWQLHSYPCDNKQCPLHFVEKKHLNKHSIICRASLLLMANRKERENQMNRILINFRKKTATISNNKNDKTPKEQVWIACYPDSSYCCTKLLNDNNNPKYCDPKNNPPIPINQCYFKGLRNHDI